MIGEVRFLSPNEIQELVRRGEITPLEKIRSDRLGERLVWIEPTRANPYGTKFRVDRTDGRR